MLVLQPFSLVLAALPVALGRKITVKNSCGTTVWPGMHTGVGEEPTQVTGWEAASGSSVTFEVSDTWTAGRIWARTGCTVQDGKFQCLTGSCGLGEAGDKTCQVTNQPPSTLAEFTLSAAGEDNYDISLVDGFNVPLNIYVSDADCTQPTCMANINALCPPLLRTGLDRNSVNLGCLAACNAGFGKEKWGSRTCCSGTYNDPILCAICGVDYYDLFKDNCNMSYAYAYDEKSGTALWTCPSTASSKPDYTIEFCPAGTDYVGSSTAGTQYLDNTATCSNMATAGTQTFEVRPNPTTTIAQGVLDVVATVATGLDGAAAIGISSSSAPPSSGASAATTSTSGPPITVSSAVPSSSKPQVVVAWKETTSTQTETVSIVPSASLPPLNLIQDDRPVRGGQWLVPQKRHTKRRWWQRGH